MDITDVLSMIRVGVDKVRELDQMLERRLREDWVGRTIEVR